MSAGLNTGASESAVACVSAVAYPISKGTSWLIPLNTPASTLRATFACMLWSSHPISIQYEHMHAR